MSIDNHPSGDFVILAQSLFAPLDDVSWCLSGLLAEHFHENNCVVVDSIDYSPSFVSIQNPQFVASPSK
jgi:hypothetical protein